MAYVAYFFIKFTAVTASCGHRTILNVLHTVCCITAAFALAANIPATVVAVQVRKPRNKGPCTRRNASRRPVMVYSSSSCRRDHCMCMRAPRSISCVHNPVSGTFPWAHHMIVHCAVRRVAPLVLSPRCF